MIISLSFLLIALFLRFAYDQTKKISTKDLVILFAVSFLVATTRSIYAILIGMFLLIPVYRIGSLKKYTIIFMSLVITVFMATQIEALKPLFQPKTADFNTANYESSVISRCTFNSGTSTNSY